MDLVIVIFILFFAAFFGLLVSCAAVTLGRAIRNKMTEMAILGLFFLLMIAYEINDIITFPYVIGILIFEAAGIANLLFLQRAFYKGRKSPLRWVIAIVLILAGLAEIVGYIRGLTPKVSPADHVIRLMQTFMTDAVIWIIAASQAKIAFRDYKRFSGVKELEPHIVQRYQIFVICAAIAAIGPIFDVIGTSLAINAPSDITFVYIVDIACLFFYSLANFLLWVMPRWFARFLDRHYTSPVPVDERRNFTNRDVMTIINYVGNNLAKLINKTPDAAKGLLYMVIEDGKVHRNTEFLRFEDLKDILSNGLKDRLYKLDVANADDITKSLVEDLIRDQSLFVMLSS
jgi:hypothetical protein